MKKEKDACNHWFIPQGSIIEVDGVLMQEFCCNICGKVGLTPVPGQKPKDDGKKVPDDVHGD